MRRQVCFLAIVVFAAAMAVGATPAERIQLDPRCQRMVSPHMGPYARLTDGILAVSDQQALVSKDDGKTWQGRPLFAQPQKFQTRPERALLRTREGVLVLVFLNEKELRRGKWLDNVEELKKFTLPTYVTRSSDEGQTWEPPRKIQDGWCGAIRSLVQLKTGRLVLAGQDIAFNPGRHVVMSYVSDDLGKSWQRSNVIDIGGSGSHGGTMEATVAQRADGHVWMLIRTTRGWFWETTSADGGLTWKDVRRSPIASSTCCGTLAGLQSGRLALLWNRSPEGRPFDLNSREELSLAFSDDDGHTWTTPVVLARDPQLPGVKASDHRLSYPYLFERRSGELWITTMQGPLRISVREADLVPQRPTGKTYEVRYVPPGQITIDGRSDEPAWSKAHVERGFRFPWKKSPAPSTEFRALWNDQNLYFSFRVHDEDMVVLDQLKEKLDAVLEDRVELYFARDEKLDDYFGVEIDPRGRVLDYRGAYYRRMDYGWTLPGLEAKGMPLPQGYLVEGRIGAAGMAAMGLPRLTAGARICAGLFRAEFSHDRSPGAAARHGSFHTQGRQAAGPPPIEEWISWNDPGTVEPDFHVRTALGYLKLVKE